MKEASHLIFIRLFLNILLLIYVILSFSVSNGDDYDVQWFMKIRDEMGNILVQDLFSNDL